jgi:enoyl-CoA hydratase
LTRNGEGAMAFETIKSQLSDRIGILTLNRPQVLNAINQRMVKELTEALAALVADPRVLAIVLHGEGRAFSAGFDMKESAERKITGVDQWRSVLEEDFDFIVQFWDCPKPTIAAVHGYCLAGAFELMLACDLTVAAEGTRLGQPEVRFGSSIVALLLPWLTGPKIAKELLFTGTDRLDAERAYEMGIVNRVVPAGEELKTALGLAEEIAAAAPLSVELIKRSVNRTYEIMGMRQALASALDAAVLIEAQAGPERSEFNRIRQEQGLKAALAWRDARFKG